MRHEVPSTVKFEETSSVHDERPPTAEIGEHVLPVTEHLPEIVATVGKNRISILVAETGAGKTTQVPKGLQRAGFKVSVTQPRRMAARMIAERINQELSLELDNDEHGLVGVHTAAMNTVTRDTRITVLTDGLRLAQELHSELSNEKEEEVLIIDEVHEWNANLEILSAWAIDVLAERPNLRVLLMSATIDAQSLADHIADATGLQPPIMEVAGRTFGVERLEKPDSTALAEVIDALTSDKTVIAVLPGVREIQDMKDAIDGHFAKTGRHDITTLPLYSKLSDSQQNATTRLYAGPKSILGTEIVQTSMTFSDADVVVDSGVSRRIEIDEEGGESLRLYNVSQAACNQRAGRVGRTHPGTYILTRLNEDTEFVSFNDRDEYPIPEILRSNIDRYVLSLACAGKTLADINLKHKVKPETVDRARHSLYLVGAMDDQGNVTPRGRHMNKFPVHPTSSRMLVEAENYSGEVQSYVAAIAAAMEVGKLPSFLHTANRNWRELSDETSDHLAQLDLFIATQTMHSSRELADLGLDVRNVERARELYDKIIRRTGTRPQELQPPTEAQREEILECVTAGLVDFVYQKSGRDSYSRVQGLNTLQRDISNRSVVRSQGPNLAVGVPYSYEHPSGEKHVIDSVSPTTVATLGKVAGWLCTWEQTGSTRWRAGQPNSEQRQMFRGELPTGNWREAPAKPSAAIRAEVIEYVTKAPGAGLRQLREIKKELERLDKLSPESVPQLRENDIEKLIERVAPPEITDPSLLNELIRQAVVSEGISIDVFVSAERREAIYQNSPDVLELSGISLRLRYSNGRVKTRIAHPRDVEGLADEVYLPDGRHVQLTYEKQPVTLEQLKELSRKK